MTRTGLGVCLCVCALAGRSVCARTVSAGTVVANPGATVAVPVAADGLANAASAVVAVNYDPTVLVCLGVEAGAAAEAEAMTYLDTGSGRIVAVFAGFAAGAADGDLMRLRFSVRDGTQGLFSDVTVADARFGAADGVTDLAAADPVAVVNGMVRVLAEDAGAARLEEAFTVWPGTRLKSLALAAGDGLTAPADGGAAVDVAGDVTTAGAIPVAAPVGGWQTGTYALLRTPTDGLTFDLPWPVTAERADGVTTYRAAVTVAGGLEILSDAGDLPTATVAQMRAMFASLLSASPEVASVTVKGDAAVIPVADDLGIAPAIERHGTVATAVYAAPLLRIVAFDPATGAVRIKVTPGAGNAIRAAFATGCVHVYGTRDLRERMTRLDGVAFDLTPYLKAETKGEADLTVSLGSHTFIKVKAELNPEGDDK